MARKPADQSVSRDDILRAAADVLQKYGYEATTMKDIAAAVSLTAASLYHHFRNKDSLLLAVLEQGLEQTIRQVEPIAFAKLPAADRLRAMIETHILGVADHSAIGAAMVFEIHKLMQIAPPRLSILDDAERYQEELARRDRFFARRDYFEQLFRQVVDEGVRSGEFQPLDVGITVKTLLGAQNWVGVWYRPDGRLPGEQIAAMMADTLLNGLLRPTNRQQY